MKLYFQYNTEDGRVMSYSEGENIVAGNFAQLELNVTDEEFEKIQRNYLLFVRDEKLVLEKSQAIINEDKMLSIEELKNAIRASKEKGEEIKIDDLVDLILQI